MSKVPETPAVLIQKDIQNSILKQKSTPCFS